MFPAQAAGCFALAALYSLRLWLQQQKERKVWHCSSAQAKTVRQCEAEGQMRLDGWLQKFVAAVESHRQRRQSWLQSQPEQ